MEEEEELKAVKKTAFAVTVFTSLCCAIFDDLAGAILAAALPSSLTQPVNPDQTKTIFITIHALIILFVESVLKNCCTFFTVSVQEF